jgi:putative methyltransferase (TIGR04325 family)
VLSIRHVKRFLPASVLRALRGLRQIRYSLRPPFEGIYPHFDDVPQKGAAFEDSEWAKSATAFSRFMAESNRGFIPYAVVGEHALLPLLVRLTSASRILDWGGATGFAYIAIQQATGLTPDYTIVEHPGVCDAGRAVMPEVRFLPQIPEESFDIVMIGAALQCVSDYRGLLERLATCKPRWFLFTRLPAGDIPTYATAQVNLHGKRHAHWLFNVRELVIHMYSLGYELVYRSAVADEINQDRFPESHRLLHPCNLLFMQRTPTS